MTLKPPFDRITVEPEKMGGAPCIRGMRITVGRLLDILATYMDLPPTRNGGNSLRSIRTSGMPANSVRLLRESGWDGVHAREIGMRDAADSQILDYTEPS